MKATAVSGDKYAGLPRLRVEEPVCSHCWQPVTIEQGTARCLGCQVSWDSVEDEAQSSPSVGPDYVPCEATRGALAGRFHGTHAYRDDGSAYDYGLPAPCVLPLGHAGEHRHPIEVTVVEVEK